MKKFYFLVILTFLLNSQKASSCTQSPPEVAEIEIISCKFNNAAEDKQLMTSLDDHYKDASSFHATADQLQEYKNNAIKQNTGAIIDGRIYNKPGKSFFYKSADDTICEKFAATQRYKFTIRQICSEAAFEAPVENVISDVGATDGSPTEVQPNSSVMPTGRINLR